MKRVYRKIILCLSLIIFFLSLQMYNNIQPFDTKNVISTISYLSSDNFKGRLTGTLENREVEQYIKLHFTEKKLKPFKGEYTQTFKVKYPHKIEGEPRLTISDDKGNIKKEFIYNEDYKEDMLNFKNNTFSFNKKEPITKSGKNFMIVNQDSHSYLFYIPSNGDLNFRSSFVSTSQWSMAVMVTEETLSSIKEYLQEGYNINCFIPFITKETTVNNVMGYIEGKNKNADPIIISAHFDHLGSDLSNTVYKGALDNASGTSFMLEMVRYISSLGKPERSILFLGFNAEEFGCIGSSEFVKEYKEDIQDSKVFNFDMIGSDNGVPLYIVGAAKDTAKTTFLRSISETCSAEGIHFNYKFGNDSDHKSFRENNIDAVTFCDNDTLRIHTPEDTPEFISITAIERCFDVVSKEVVKYAFGNNILILYYKEALLASGSILIIIILFSYLRKRR